MSVSIPICAMAPPSPILPAEFPAIRSTSRSSVRKKTSSVPLSPPGESANPLTLRSSVRIAVDTVFRRPDDEAPVSSLYLFGRREDLAFEKPVGDSPKERHHVRFWRTEKLDEGQVVWIGSAAFDIGVELSLMHWAI